MGLSIDQFLSLLNVTKEDLSSDNQVTYKWIKDKLLKFNGVSGKECVLALAPFLEKLDEVSSPISIKVQFAVDFMKLLNQDQGIVDWESFSRLKDDDYTVLSDIKNDNYSAKGESVLSKTVVLKLNGGLGTAMKCQMPKSCISIFGSDTFLDVIGNQLSHLRQRYSVSLPLLLLNSRSTLADTQRLFKDRLEYTSLMQHEFPRIDVNSLKPFSHVSSLQEWNPAGHGDVYYALYESGYLDLLISGGYDYMFLSNSDNVSATLDLDILGYMASNNIDFLMEMTPKPAYLQNVQ